MSFKWRHYKGIIGADLIWYFPLCIVFKTLCRGYHHFSRILNISFKWRHYKGTIGADLIWYFQRAWAQSVRHVVSWIYKWNHWKGIMKANKVCYYHIGSWTYHSFFLSMPLRSVYRHKQHIHGYWSISQINSLFIFSFKRVLKNHINFFFAKVKIRRMGHYH